MNLTARIQTTLLIALLSLSAVPMAPGELLIIGATESDFNNVTWAIERYAAADLELPPMIIEFHDDDSGCRGHDGLFRGGERPVEIHVCTRNRYIVLHEMAHAWDHHNLTDAARQEFMELRDLETWGDHDVPWRDRGVEALAQTITWGLYDTAIGDGDVHGPSYRLLTGDVPVRDRPGVR